MPSPEGFRSLQDVVDRLRGRMEMRVLKSAPPAKPGTVVVYARLNGLGKTELVAQHPTGVPQVISTEP